MAKTPEFDLRNDYSRNYIINGNFDFWQRGTSEAATPFAYLADRFAYAASPALTVDYDRSTDVPNINSLYSMEISRAATISPANNELAYIRYIMEGNDLQQIFDKTITLSFYVKSTTVGTYCINLRNGDSDRIYIAEYTIDVANTWEKKIVTIDLDPGTSSGTWYRDHQAGLQIRWELSVGSDFFGTADSWQNGNFHSTSNQTNLFSVASSSFKLAQVQVLEGVQELPFRRAGKDISNELSLCQRYYEKSYHLDTPPAGSTFVGSACFSIASNGFFRKSIEYSVSKRNGSNTITLYNPVTGTIGEARRDSGSAIGVGSSSGNHHGFHFQTGGGNISGVEYRTQWTVDSEF